MFKGFVIALVLVSMALTFYSVETVMVITDQDEAVSVLDVCSYKTQAGFVMAPAVPTQEFSFAPQRTYQSIFPHENIEFTQVYLPLIDKPPVV